MLLPWLLTAVVFAVPLAGCQTVAVDRPCGVIRDSLRTVIGATPDDSRRITIHYERGRAAGCWE